MAGEGFEIALLVGRTVKTQQNQQILRRVTFCSDESARTIQIP